MKVKQEDHEHKRLFAWASCFDSGCEIVSYNNFRLCHQCICDCSIVLSDKLTLFGHITAFSVDTVLDYNIKFNPHIVKHCMATFVFVVCCEWKEQCNRVVTELDGKTVKSIKYYIISFTCEIYFGNRFPLFYLFASKSSWNALTSYILHIMWKNVVIMKYATFRV